VKTNLTEYHNLRRKDFNHEEACVALGLDPEVVKFAVEVSGDKVWSIENARKEMLPLAFDVLKQVLETGERDADRIKAAQIIIQGEGVLPEVNVEEHSERRRRWLQAVGEHNIIDVGPKQLMEMAS
jgi:hypothetical protein